MTENIGIVAAFDDLRSADMRFIEEAAKLGPLTVCALSDQAVTQITGAPPKFPLPERIYFLERVRFVTRVVEAPAAERPPDFKRLGVTTWVDSQNPGNETRRRFCLEAGVEYQVLSPPQLSGFPQRHNVSPPGGHKKVVVTGCYDWLHSGHVRFFEEVSTYGELYVIVGHDANIRLLKGEGHPLISQEERRYMVSAIRYVTQALISSGEGWLDADPEIQRIKPDIYAVNDDGDRGGKREYCEKRGIKYLVLKRRPAPGLPARTSTGLRGF
jgi:cytidyltransferase-like protein